MQHQRDDAGSDHVHRRRPGQLWHAQLRCHDVEDLDARRVQLHHRRHVAHIVGPVYVSGANTTYSISDAPVAGLNSGGSTLSLTAAATTGSETIGFVSSPAGYTVTYTAPGGAATGDAVDAAAATGSTVTLTLAKALATGDSVDIAAPGMNPAPTALTQADDVTVQAGDAPAERTNSIEFGNSVTGVIATIAPGRQHADHLHGRVPCLRRHRNGKRHLPQRERRSDNFTTVTSIEVIDSTENWHFLATGAVLAQGTATISPSKTPSMPGTRSASSWMTSTTRLPQARSTTSRWRQQRPGRGEAAARYTIVANASPGVVVTVNPDTTGSVAVYTISNIHASAALTGGTSTIRLEAPSGTVFPNNPVFYRIVDATTPSGSGTVTGALSGGGTNIVTFTVPDNIASGDVLTLRIADIRNPDIPSSTYSISVIGNVTGPKPTAPPPPRPAVRDLTARAGVSKKGTVDLKLHCSVAACKGTVTLTDVRTVVAVERYSLRAGKQPPSPFTSIARA